jgi:hypothetical protein
MGQPLSGSGGALLGTPRESPSDFLPKPPVWPVPLFWPTETGRGRGRLVRPGSRKRLPSKHRRNIARPTNSVICESA